MNMFNIMDHQSLIADELPLRSQTRPPANGKQDESLRHLVYVPTLYPADFSMHARKAVVEPFPLVPATCTAGHASCGFPSAASNRLMRPCRVSMRLRRM